MEDERKHKRTWRSAIASVHPAAWLTAAKVVVGAIGLALLVVGVVKAAGISANASIITLIIVGAVLLVSPFLIDRLEGLSVSTTSIDIRFVRDISELGAPKAAQILRHTNIASFADSYALIHDGLAEKRFSDAKKVCRTVSLDNAQQ